MQRRLTDATTLDMKKLDITKTGDMGDINKCQKIKKHARLKFTTRGNLQENRSKRGRIFSEQMKEQWKIIKQSYKCSA